LSKVIVIGMGKSGQAAYNLLKIRGHDPLGVDNNSTLLSQLQEKGIQVSLSPQIQEFDLVVLSPGIPPTNEWLLQAKKLGKEIIGEAELGLRELRMQTIVGVTGTNGKTTVTLLVEHILKESGRQAVSLGNVGTPFTEYCLRADPQEIVVSELSSYQLETLTSKVLSIGIVLNITPDHLDRYSDMEEYARAKSLIQNCMAPESTLYVNAEVLREFGSLFKGKFHTFGTLSGAFLWTDGHVVKELENVEFSWPPVYHKLGAHEIENALAAWAICKELGVEKELFLKALETFKRPAHRIEFVKEIRGVFYFNDSKGTNIDATIKAVYAMRGPVILIAGGVDKGASYKIWKEKFAHKVRMIFAIGESAEKIKQELLSDITVHIVSSLEEAVEKAGRCARSGESVLLSPGCASFDMFRDYAHRGEEFRRFVHKGVES
jgi:UDP-N-acetylmuramoylalanine--D-glutamate ligase